MPAEDYLAYDRRALRTETRFCVPMRRIATDVDRLRFLPDMDVLLIDDEAPIRLLCRVNLEDGGINVSEASDGARGLEQARASKPDLIFLDMMMPGRDGLSIAEELRADVRTRDVPIVFLSAKAEFCACVNELGLSDVAALAEPFNPLELALFATDFLRSARERGPSAAESLEALWSLRTIATRPNDQQVVGTVGRRGRDRTSDGGSRRAFSVAALWSRVKTTLGTWRQ